MQAWFFPFFGNLMARCKSSLQRAFFGKKLAQWIPA